MKKQQIAYRNLLSIKQLKVQIDNSIVFMTTIIKQTACHKIISEGQNGLDRGVLDACHDPQY